jgi:hypothetical protein
LMKHAKNISTVFASPARQILGSLHLQNLKKIKQKAVLTYAQQTK